MPGDFLTLIAVAEFQSMKQRFQHRLRKPCGPSGCGFEHVSTAPDQMTQAGLVKRVGKTIVGLPTVMVQESRVVLTEDRGGLSKSTSGQNRIDRDLGVDTNPEPFQMRCHSPAGLIELIDRTLTDGHLKFLIRRFGLLSQSRHRAAERATANSQAVTPFQNLAS